MGSEHIWAHRTHDLSGLSYRFAVRTDDRALGRLADALLAGLHDPDAAAPAAHVYSLTASDAAPGSVDMTRDGEPLACAQRPGGRAGLGRPGRQPFRRRGEWRPPLVPRRRARGGRYRCAGARGLGFGQVDAGGRAGPRGLGYLTDELVALDMARGRLRAYPKPITVKPGSFAVLADMDPGLGAAPAAVAWAGAEWQVPVGDGTVCRIGRPCEPGVVVLPRYDAGAETALTALSDTEAFLSLALNAVNLLPHGAAGAEALGRLVAGCRCYGLTMSDLGEACRLVLELLAEPAAAAGDGGRGADHAR